MNTGWSGDLLRISSGALGAPQLENLAVREKPPLSRPLERIQKIGFQDNPECCWAFAK